MMEKYSEVIVMERFFESIRRQEKSNKILEVRQSFGIAGKTLIATDYSGNTSFYDTVTGEPIQQDEVLAEALKGKLSEMNFVTFGSDQVLFHTGDEENSLYYCDSTGLYRHIWGGSVQELLIDGVMNSLGNPDSERKAMVSP